MDELTAKPLIDCKNRLGKGVQWNDELQRVYWTDIFSDKLLSCDQNGDNVCCSNSLVFSSHGDTLYFADATGYDIFAYDYRQTSGTSSNKRFFARMDEKDGKPDGSTVDADGELWSARFGGAKVQRFLPDGSRDLTIHLPVPNVTCCAIGGSYLDRLFITTARLLMDDRQLADFPAAGGLFVCDLPVRGIAPGRYRDPQSE